MYSTGDSWAAHQALDFTLPGSSYHVLNQGITHASINSFLMEIFNSGKMTHDILLCHFDEKIVVAKNCVFVGQQTIYDDVQLVN